MPICCRSSDIKSSVYNQTGEGFFQQLTAYNHMTAHLRRVLLAKSRINSRNPSYIQKQQRGRGSLNDKLLDKSISQEFIDRLAYDTEHHPMEILRTGCHFENHCEKYSRSQDRSRRYTACNSSYIECPASRIHTATIRQLESERSRSMSRTRVCGRGPTFHSARPGRSQRKSSWRSRDDVNTDGFSSRRGGPISVNSSIRSSPRSNKSKNENDPGCSYASSFESSSEVSRRGSPVPKVSAPSPSPVESTSSTQPHRNIDDSCANLDSNDEEAKYFKFLYDITQEIVQHGYYTDEEFQNVFKKHIRKNLHILDKNKMMYELYQLKLSLNIINDEDEEENENVEQFMSTRKFSHNLTPKPPTPPKVLDENKLMDKLMSQDELEETYRRSSASGKNAVVLVDANPELLISERDILTTLIEMNIEPKQAQNVYKGLQKKSRELSEIQLKNNRPDYIVFRERTLGQVHPEKKNTARLSSVLKVTPEQHTDQSIDSDIQYHHRNPMNINRTNHIMRIDELLINRDNPSLVTLEYPYQRKCQNIHPDEYFITDGDNKMKVCQYETQMLDVRLPDYSVACKTSPRHQSIKSKLTNEINITEKKRDENKKKKKKKKIKSKERRELIDNQFAYTSRTIYKRQTSSLSELEGLQSERMGRERMKDNIGVEIKNIERAQQSQMKKLPTHYNYDSRDIGMEEMNSSTDIQFTAKSSIDKDLNQNDDTEEFLHGTIENSSSTKYSAKSSEIVNDIQEYFSDNSNDSIVESIEEDNSSHIIENLNSADALESDVDFDVEEITNRMQYDIYGIADENTSTKNQIQQYSSNESLIHVPLFKNLINNETQVDIDEFNEYNEFNPEIPLICLCNANIPCDYPEFHNHQPQSLEYFYDKNNNSEQCDVNFSTDTYRNDTNSTWKRSKNMVLCESCEYI